MLRALVLTALVAQAAALAAGSASRSLVSKPVVANRAIRVMATVSLEEEGGVAETVKDLGITALRLGTCALMVHHGFDKIQNVDGFSVNVVAKFFGFLPGPPQFWTLSAA